MPVGGGPDACPTADRLAAFGGVAPAPRDSGRTRGNFHRPQRYHRRLRRAFSTSAPVSTWTGPSCERFHQHERSEGKRHTQAVIALARRRANVSRALVHDRRCHPPAPPVISTA
ncbi:transposase [Streptomyces sp. DSM 44938]|uniref:Transposase n=1 Tax=Streptomyces litchfieldiae TaxID=3075543 RepID=A0ABU2MI69_9ACTN|nr:transposase [Streptomyces sp. DSM 44938]MDT0341113.1 transposase [Streptomyces sp. DSM 44938]